MNTRKIIKLFTPLPPAAAFSQRSDIQPLINEGATKEDLSASIFQAVVNQTISGLACGKPIRGHVAFLGGPLHFLSELKAAFIRTLKLDDEHAITPENSHLFAAIGSALNYDEKVSVSLSEMVKKLSSNIKLEFEVARLDPLFASREAYEKFTERQNQYSVAKTETFPPMKETASSASTPVPPPPRQPWSARTEACFTLSTAATTEAP